MDDTERWLVTDPVDGFPRVRHLSRGDGVTLCYRRDRVREARPEEVAYTRVCRACLTSAGVHVAIDPVRRLTQLRAEIGKAHARLAPDWPTAAGLLEAMQAGIDAYVESARAGRAGEEL